ncbi:MAG: dTDP-4-dehydrorhamnose 3,5-epimerase family protein [Candidatus Aenigmatarchaeota archaeon]
MLEGIKILELKKHVDERGSFMEVMRKDWKDFLEGDEIVQANISINYPNIVKAWHKHERGQVDYFFVLRGCIKVCAYDEIRQELDEIILSEEKPQIVRIPGKYWHGFKVVSNIPAIVVYFTTKLYEYNNPDELRKSWNDSSIIPKIINGKEDDPRCNKPWDWFYPPHR